MTNMQPAPRIAVPAAIDPAALIGFDPQAPVVQFGGTTMGTTWQVRAALPVALGLDTARLTMLVQARLDGIVQDMSHWVPGSNLARYNQAYAGSVCALSLDMVRVMETALAVAQATNGAFDPAIGRLTDLWGLGPNPVSGPPPPAAVDHAMKGSGWRRLHFDPVRCTLRQPGGLWLDLSGIAKGFAVDAVADLLGQQGLVHCLVEIGGECAGRGMRPDGDPWWVDVENPPELSLPVLRVALLGLAIATSGDYLRGAHTIDPRTGCPAIHSTTAVTVVHPDCMSADAWATALSVMDASAAQRCAEREDIAVRIVSRDGGEWLSPALAAMMDLEPA